MTETRKLALDWLRSCQAQTPSVEEVEKLIDAVYELGYNDARCLYYDKDEFDVYAEEGYRTAMEIIDNGSSK